MNLNLQIFFFCFLFDFHHYLDASLVGELYGVALQLKQYLNDPLLVGDDDGTVSPIHDVGTLRNINECGSNLDSLQSSFMILHLYYIFNDVSDIKRANILLKFLRLDLS